MAWGISIALLAAFVCGFRFGVYIQERKVNTVLTGIREGKCEIDENNHIGWVVP